MHAPLPSCGGPSQLAQLVGRLASLSAHELQCLHGDPELERQLAHTQYLLELRLQQLQARLGQPVQLLCQQPLDLTGVQPSSTPPSTLTLGRSSSASSDGASSLERPLNPKKAKLDEYRRALELEEHQLALAHSVDQRPSRPAAKKYKGEFDEPTPLELELRQRQLMRPDSYHRRLAGVGEAGCACLLGSRFESKSPDQVLDMVQRWRSLPNQQRIAHKWDVADLPKDIPLSDIKRLEDLRRDLSQGRADFGGASKRKPLGIRGTRQFLLVLYCLWGHPGRTDPMQRDGYCPHCFAKIKKANEQSTLVRLVNHFNMKHRQGANPRLSPHSRTHTPLNRTSPSLL